MSRRHSLTLHGVEDATAAQLDDFHDLFFGDTRAGSSERRRLPRTVVECAHFSVPKRRPMLSVITCTVRTIDKLCCLFRAQSLRSSMYHRCERVKGSSGGTEMT